MTQNEQTLQPILDHLQITNWDLFIIGDGSGSTWAYPIGYASLLFERNEDKPQLFYGGLNLATVNISELLPTLHALMWHYRTKLNGEFKFINTHIITDCAIIEKQGNKKASKDANGPLWAAVDSFARYGYQMQFHWIDRNVFAEMVFCDALSKTARKSIKSLDISYDPTVTY